MFNSAKISEAETTKILLANSYLETLTADRDFCRNAMVITKFRALVLGKVTFKLGLLIENNWHYNIRAQLTRYSETYQYDIYNIANNFDETRDEDRLETLDAILAAISDQVQPIGIIRYLIEEINTSMRTLFGENYPMIAGRDVDVPPELFRGQKFYQKIGCDASTYAGRAPALRSFLKDIIRASDSLLLEGEKDIARLHERLRE